ncbi:MAG: D-alanyl-D-alanine carboxypeptidase family protein [Gammaproteobacteria bacterium]
MLQRLVLFFLVAQPLYAAVPIPKPPEIAARSFILVDHHSGRVLAEQRADEPMEPASITKLMTAYVVFDALKEGRLKLDDPVTISKRAWKAEGSRTFVQVDTQVPVEVLIQGMIVQSGNDATIALAERVGGTDEAFAQLMNEYARRLGMKGTKYGNSPGMPSPNQYTTARDTATLSRALIAQFPEYYRWYSQREFTWNKITQPNRNGLLARDPTVDGIKTGHTESAGYCLASSANRNGMRLTSVVMGAPTWKGREDASAALLNYGYTFYETVKIKGRGETVLKPRVYKSEEEIAAIGTAQDVYVTVGRGETAKLRTEARVSEPLVAPLSVGQSVGELVVAAQGGEIVARSPLVPLAPVNEGGWWTQLTDTVALWLH